MPDKDSADELAFTVDWKGTTHRFAPMDNYKVSAAYERYLKAHAIKQVQMMRVEYGDDYADAIQGVRQDIDAGLYNYAGKQWVLSLKNMEHQKQLLFLMAQYHNRELERSWMDELYADKDKMAEVMTKWSKAEEADADPNAKPAAPEAPTAA